jgi:integrase/recombinase XerD
MGEEDVRVAAGRVLAALREAGRSEGTIRRCQVVMDLFPPCRVGRGLSAASDQVRVDFIARQAGARLGALREPVADGDVQAVRRLVVLMADALAGRPVVTDRPVVVVKDGCPARFRPLRDEYVASCRARGNAEATLVAKGKAASRPPVPGIPHPGCSPAGSLAALSARATSGNG